MFGGKKSGRQAKHFPQKPPTNAYLRFFSSIFHIFGCFYNFLVTQLIYSQFLPNHGSHKI